MLMFKVAPIFLMALFVGAEKKIELQDIEEDNLKSEKEKDFGETEARSQGSAQSSQGLPLEFLKNGILRYFENSPQQQQTRYIHQYDVTEPPEKSPPVVAPKQQYGPSGPQQAMVGYLSNVPMQIYLVPQYYNEQSGPVPSPQPSPAYSTPHVPYSTAQEAVQSQTNYIEVPAYVSPGGKTYVQQYTPPVTYVSYNGQSAVTPAPTVASVLAYQMPVVQYTPTIPAPTSPSNEYHYQTPHYTETNTVDEVHENENEAPKQYTTHTEVSYSKAPAIPDFHRYYSARTPHREEYRHGPISELPPPNPLILKASPPHLSHIPKALPMYRPLTKPSFSNGVHGYTPRTSDPYGPPYKRRPTSLLDSYIPSSVQIEYLKRGFAKDPLEAYEALSSGRHLIHSHNAPRHYERGFLPNQMYHTAAGGVTYGHYKRSPKVDKAPHQ